MDRSRERILFEQVNDSYVMLTSEQIPVEIVEQDT